MINRTTVLLGLLAVLACTDSIPSQRLRASSPAVPLTNASVANGSGSIADAGSTGAQVLKTPHCPVAGGDNHQLCH